MVTHEEEIEIDRHVHLAQTHPDTLHERMKGDPVFLDRVKERLARYDAMARVGRMEACWVSRRANDTLRTALAALNKGVP